MSKAIFSMMVAALFSVAGSAFADQGISTSTLNEMGLSGLTVVSDHDALAIRGMGFRGGLHSKCNSCGARGKVAPYSPRFGQLVGHDRHRRRRLAQRKRLLRRRSVRRFG